MTQSIVYICLFLGIIDSIPNSSVQSYCFNIDYIYVYFYDKGFENEWEQVRKSLNQLCFFYIVNVYTKTIMIGMSQYV